VGVQEPLELLGGQGSHRQAAALVDRRAQPLQILVFATMGVGIGVLAHVLLPSASALAAVAFLVAEVAAMQLAQPLLRKVAVVAGAVVVVG
jgi:hypothetical protein